VILRVEALAKRFPPARGRESVAAVAGISFETRRGELFTLLGPSGCGKTTTLRCIAGLDRPDGGEIEVAGRMLFSSGAGVDVPASERGLGMVFQSYAIWPHMNVFANAAFPLSVLPRRRRPSRQALRERVERALGVVRLDHAAGRRATELSGGEQQRLALARALVVEPQLLLLDEPLSNLDARLRDEMRFELRRLQRELGITCLYVTHDQSEALAISNVVAVMRAGRLEQIGTPREIYDRPGSRFVADFIGAANLLDGVVEQVRNGMCDVRTAVGVVRAPSTDAVRGQAVVLIVRPEHVRLGDDGWPATVVAEAFLGETVDRVVRVGPLELRARSSPSALVPPDLRVSLPPEACLVLPGGDGGTR